MKTRLIKIIKIIFIVICALGIFENCVLAAYDVSGSFSGNSTKVGNATNSAKNILYNVLDAVRIIGVAVAVVLLMYVAIKFMTAAPSERANIKQYSINFVIGAAILFGTSGIITLVQKIADAAFPGT